MDPRIGWHPNELISEAYSTWTNVWMIAQINNSSMTSTTQNNTNNNSNYSQNIVQPNTHSQSCNVNNPYAKSESVASTLQDDNNTTQNSYDKFITLLENAICSCNTTNITHMPILPLCHYRQTSGA